MRNYLIIFLLLLLNANAYSQVNPVKYWQQQTDFTIQVQLDDILNSLEGFEKIVYTNHSPDTLNFIWFHLWPNAYKDDKTAFSEQLLRNGRTDFYFSDEESRGYISNILFKINGVKADTLHHLKYGDVLKVLLPQPLLPGHTDTITTPFHVKLPNNFSRGGHIAQSYQITQWYPKPAVYDYKGWHPMTYLDQGEFYSEFGDFDVKITLPENYIVAGSGELQSAEELRKLLTIASTKVSQQSNFIYYNKRILNKQSKPLSPLELYAPRSAANNKTLSYHLSKAHDFAWFASKQFIVLHDTIQLSKKIVDVFSYYPPWAQPNWKKSITYAKEGLQYYDTHLGSYPYSTASVVSGPQTIGSGGMEYPSITLITTQSGGKELDETIAHELGHNWFYGSLASNERDHAWMDEGMNTFYERKYVKAKYANNENGGEVLEQFSENNMENILANHLSAWNKGQSLDLPSEEYTSVNYGLFVYQQTSMWMDKLKKQLGSELFEKSMKNYYAKWQFKHPYPENFKQSIEEASNKSIDTLYKELFVSSVPRFPIKKPIKSAFFFPLKNTDKYQYISWSPMFGYNSYDKLMVGGMIHNYQLPNSKFNFIAIPLYATGTKVLNYYTRVSYKLPYKNGTFESININTSVSKFTYNQANFIVPAIPKSLNLQYYKVDPTIRFNIRNSNLLSSTRSFIQFKSYFIGEQNYLLIGGDSIHPAASKAAYTARSFTQLKFLFEDNRVLYPYSIDATFEGNDNFLKAGITAKYFYNYPEGNNHGLDIRFFAGKFFNLKTDKIYQNDLYRLTLTAPRGADDYAYGNYFIGRSARPENNDWQSQQLMERDGFFKVGTELQGSPGRTDNWLSAINLSGNIPDKINPLKVLPIQLPIKFFLDIGTYAEAWDESVTGSHFLYDAGFQLTLLHGNVNVYVPLLYSKVYRDYYQSFFSGKTLLSSISFSIDIQKIKLNTFVKGVTF